MGIRMEGKKVLDGLKYTEKHEWVKIDGASAVFGITDFAQNALGDLVFIDLPKVGRQIKKGDSCGTVESVKAAEDVYSPIGGEVAEINSEVTKNPALVNSNPYDSWMVKLKNPASSDFDSLMSADKYREYISKL